MAEILTRVDRFGDWYAKREDLAGYTGDGAPSGAKVRQYVGMIANSDPSATLMVGCSADSAMQVYVSHAAATHGRTGIVVVPKRKARSDATEYAIAMGAEVVEVSPGYPSVYRARCREIAAERNLKIVRWDREYAARDTAAQVANIPEDVTRVIVPTGSGLTAAGVMGGLSAIGRNDVVVVAACVSDMANGESIAQTCEKFFGQCSVNLVVVPPASAYGKGVKGAVLPNGDGLDPFYAAKAMGHVTPGSMLWVSGRRPGVRIVTGP